MSYQNFLLFLHFGKPVGVKVLVTEYLLEGGGRHKKNRLR